MLGGRRESRRSMLDGGIDQLTEFENYKRAFLKTNKQIAKLNSTLSARIQELETEKMSFYNENMRLRASEVALAQELKREKERTRKVLEDMETAFSFIRQTHHIPTEAPPPPPPQPAKRLVTDAVPRDRLSREPTVPGILEDDEPVEKKKVAKLEDTTERKTLKSRPRLSASRLPLPSAPSPPPPVDLATLTPAPRKRRSSQLVVRREVEVEEPDDILNLSGDEFDELPPKPRSKARKELKDMTNEMGARASSPVAPEELPIKKSKSRSSLNNEIVSTPAVKPRSRREELQPTAEDILHPRPKSRHAEPMPIEDGEDFVPLRTSKPRSRRRDPPLPTPSPEPRPPTTREAEDPEPEPEPEPEPVARRARRSTSVNYAEPKLNTKMRRPDGVPPLRKPLVQRASGPTMLAKRRPSQEDGQTGSSGSAGRRSGERRWSPDEEDEDDFDPLMM